MKHTVITIGREYGSGGHEIGARLAKRLGIPFYDKELIDIAAEKTGCCENFVRSTDEKKPSVFARSATFSRGYAVSALSPEDNIFVQQSLIIRELAAKSSCVIVGRCADYVLQDEDYLVSVFVYAPLQDRINRKKQLSEEEKTEAEIKKEILAMDKRREKYYSFYTGSRWGDSRNYHICLDTAKVGIEHAVDVILNFVNQADNCGILPD